MSDESLRIDRWLWCARFFKSRSLAAEEVKAGHVRLNGQRIKPSRELKVGDTLTVAKGDFQYELAVAGIPARRGPAAEAARCYLESPESIAGREAVRASHAVRERAPTAGRPDKRTRRLIRSRVRDSFNSE